MTVEIDCDGMLSVDDDAFFPLRLAGSIAPLPDDRALVLGGQTAFEPFDDNDVRLLQWSGSAWSELGAFDIYTDFVTAGRIATTPDGAWGILPNSSIFSEEHGDVVVLSIRGDTVTERQRFSGLLNSTEVAIDTAGTTALVSRFDTNQVDVLSLDEGTWSQGPSATGIGLADQMAMVHRGALDGTVLLPSIDPTGGPNIAMIRVTGPGVVEDLGQVELGSGAVNIPGAIAVAP